MTSSGHKAGSGLNDLLIYNSSQESHVTSKGSLYPAKVAFSLGMGKVRTVCSVVAIVVKTVFVENCWCINRTINGLTV